MKVILLYKGPNYEIKDVINIFYPTAKVCIAENRKEADYDLFLHILLLDKSAVKIRINNQKGNLFEQCCGYIAGIYDGHNKNHDFKMFLKVQLYKALSSITGISSPWGVLTGIRPAKIVHNMLDEGYTRENIENILISKYLMSHKKTELLINTAKNARDIINSNYEESVSLYIGIPFCPSRCLYCSFPSYSMLRVASLVEPYLKALENELMHIKYIIEEKNFKICNLYIGGGTPTALPIEHLGRLLAFIEKIFDTSSVCEYTLEAGRPDSLNEGKLKIIKESNVSRISINPQTMNDSVLKIIGRNHSAKDIIDTFYMARRLGFKNINMDVIAGLPAESYQMFVYSLKEIERLAPDSLTVHTMAIKRASKLREDIKKWKLPEPQEVSKMIDFAGECAAKMGMQPYYLYRQKNILGNLENVGYAKKECRGIYNVQIMEERQSILAAGAGGISKIIYPKEGRIERAFNVKNVEEYIKRVDEMVDRKKKLIT